MVDSQNNKSNNCEHKNVINMPFFQYFGHVFRRPTDNMEILMIKDNAQGKSSRYPAPSIWSVQFKQLTRHSLRFNIVEDCEASRTNIRTSQKYYERRTSKNIYNSNIGDSFLSRNKFIKWINNEVDKKFSLIFSRIISAQFIYFHIPFDISKYILNFK